MARDSATSGASNECRLRLSSRFRFLTMVLSILSVLIFSVAILPGCSKKSTKPEKTEDPYAPQTSPENVVQNLTVAYELRDVDGYAELLAEDFQFVFSQEDQQQPGCPAGLEYGDELEIHTNLFSEALVDSVSISFAIGELQFDESASSPGDSIWLLPVMDMTVYLKGRLPGRPDMTPQRWQMNNGSARFWLRQSVNGVNSTDPVAWEIVKCEETTISGTFMGNPALPQSSRCVDTPSWGGIKSMFK